MERDSDASGADDSGKTNLKKIYVFAQGFRFFFKIGGPKWPI